MERRSASLRPVVGQQGGERAGVGRLGDRRVTTAGSLDRPLFEAGHDMAGRVVELLANAGIDLFAVARRGDGIEFGIKLEQRELALEALVASLDTPGVHITWEDGSRSSTVALADAPGRRSVRRARRWNVFTAYSWGDRAIGETAGTRITFWEVGTSGQRELIGTREQERFHVESPRTPAMVDGHEYPGVATFPVGCTFEEFLGDIDIVYTWVDGDDADWQASFQHWAAVAGHEVPAAAFDPARFRNRDELKYSLRSVWAYCGWVRNIYIVTSGQVPEWLVEDSRVRVVPHSEILPEDALPTFNSHAIESALHRIDGLAEHFVYLNDDVFIGRSLRPEAFFTPNGLPLVFQSTARVHGAEYVDSLAVDTAALRARALLLERFGRVVSSKPLHAPFSLRRSVIGALVDDFPDVVRLTESSRFRAPTDLSIAASFASHYALGRERAVLGTINCQYVHVESDRLSWALNRISLGDDVDTFCINETRNIEGDHTDREAQLHDFFEMMFPVPAPWEAAE